jgi:hypothetical protein
MIRIKVPNPYKKEGTPITMEIGKGGFKRTEIISKYNLIEGSFFYVDNETTYVSMGVGLTSTRQKVANFF